MYAFSKQRSLFEKHLKVEILRGTELVSAMKDKVAGYLMPKKPHICEHVNLTEVTMTAQMS